MMGFARIARGLQSAGAIAVVTIGAVGLGCSAGDDPTASNTTEAGADSNNSTTPVSTITATVPPPSNPAAEQSTPTTAPPTTLAPSEVIATIDEADAVLGIIRSRPDLTRFAELVGAVDADRVFLQQRGVTVLAPIDEAWEQLDDQTWQELLADPDAAALTVAEYLSIGGTSLADLVEIGTFDNAMSRSIEVIDGDPVTIGGVPVVEADLTADNGYVHVLGALLSTS